MDNPSSQGRGSGRSRKRKYTEEISQEDSAVSRETEIQLADSDIPLENIDATPQEHPQSRPSSHQDIDVHRATLASPEGQQNEVNSHTGKSPPHKQAELGIEGTSKL
jgi:hypothetical protein